MAGVRCHMGAEGRHVEPVGFVVAGDHDAGLGGEGHGSQLGRWYRMFTVSRAADVDRPSKR